MRLGMDTEFLKEHARKLRRLARNIVDREAQRELLEMADEYDAQAAKLHQGRTEQSPS
jgi:hypothetical protein